MDNAAEDIHERSRVARTAGAELYARYYPLSTEECFCTFTKEEVESVGGESGWVRIFTRFYELFSSDPVLACLLDYNDEQLPAVVDIATVDPVVVNG